ncbi:tripartite tricarboxylate transporter TctB family protein [Halomarina halobia]|uniref:Tripartite tricarboxylate transporter TctB family protein n=1 Tax=Halomarina halobia TaxID=3033386 RepID=A0ABD6AFD0_9EURY|nr:tripartite tricarboxylate transporter TctB family protein [Halomarina sp. PSR21]
MTQVPENAELGRRGGDVDSTDATADIDHSRFAYRLGKRLLFPAIVVVFAALYVMNTYGSIALKNLVYPFVVIGALLIALIAAVVGDLRTTMEEQRELRTLAGDIDGSELNDSVTERIARLRNPILTAIGAIGYLLLIHLVGFFLASALTMIGLMRATGTERTNDWRYIIGVTVALLLAIYVLFVQFLGLRVPQGILGLM